MVYDHAFHREKRNNLAIMELSESEKDFIQALHKILKKRQFYEYKVIEFESYVRA
jgi:hypothetical protein